FIVAFGISKAPSTPRQPSLTWQSSTKLDDLDCNTGLQASYSLQPTGADQQRNQESDDDP
ncbi:hypothetical protein IRJ41_005910, partial [Triplophysa rosa]